MREAEPERRGSAAVAVAPGSSTADTVARATQVLDGSSKKRGLGRLLPFLGPAFIACIAYIDPGNFATNIAAGAQYGYLLVWVIVASNLMAMLIQVLSAKLGIATGRNLPELCRDHFPRPVTYVLWILAEIVAIATDLAEFLGAALGFYLLFGIPLFPAALITAVATFVILALQQRGFRPLEAVIAVAVGVIALCYILETVLGKPDWGATALAFAPPRFEGTESVLLAVGILGATVMPHVIYLHSSLTQNRIPQRNDAMKHKLLRFETIDVLIAMPIAGFINVAMLLLAAATFHANGFTDIDAIVDAHKTLEPLLGGASSAIFAISLLVSGLSSSAVGTMAGQVIMQGFIERHIPLWIRRAVTLVPSLIIIGLGIDATRALIVSQVVLRLRHPLRARAARDLHAPPRYYGCTGQPDDHDGHHHRDCGDHHRAESLSASAHVLWRVSRCSRISSCHSMAPHSRKRCCPTSGCSRVDSGGASHSCISSNAPRRKQCMAHGTSARSWTRKRTLTVSLMISPGTASPSRRM